MSAAPSSEQDLVISALGTEGDAAPPRDNGELVFSQPWESRSFALVMSLAEQGAFTLDDFRDELIAAIGRWEATAEPDAEYRYYECWLEALERIVGSRDLVPAGVLNDRVHEFAARPAGHDHSHADGDHHHDHNHDH